jgi:hypothetical protein
LDVRHNGIEVVCEIVNTWWAPDGQRTLTETTKAAPNAMMIGFVPFRFIEHINVSGDEYRYSPIYYVAYRGPGKSPYSHFNYVESQGSPLGPSGRLYYASIDDLGELRRGRFVSWIRLQRYRVRSYRFERANRKDKNHLPGRS